MLGGKSQSRFCQAAPLQRLGGVVVCWRNEELDRAFPFLCASAILQHQQLLQRAIKGIQQSCVMTVQSCKEG